MTNDRDPIDAWLERDIAPLTPRAGTLDRIRRTARRRKTTQAVMAAAGCAVIIAAAVTVPQLTASPHQFGLSKGPPAAGSTSPASERAGTLNTSAAASRATPLPSQGTHLSAGTSGTAPPPRFRPTSVTMVGTGTGHLVGAVIGQAGPPCATQYCTSLAGTSNYGKSWYGVSAPLTGGPQGGTGVSQLRFLDLQHGWAFGPQLWETSNGGWPWIREDSYGMRVIALEAVGQRAFAIFARCTGTGTNYAGSCTSFSLYSSVAGSRSWTAVAVPAPFRQMSTPVPAAASLVIAGRTGYLLTPSGQLLRGSVAGGSWTVAGQAPCLPGTAQASGLPASAQLAIWPSLVLACDTTTSRGYQTTIYSSASGATWQPAGRKLSTAGAPASLSASPIGTLVLATSAGIYHSATHGATWQVARIAGPQPPGGFSYVGMTTQSQGVAVPADAALHEIFVTGDGGRTWIPSPIAA